LALFFLQDGGLTTHAQFATWLALHAYMHANTRTRSMYVADNGSVVHL